MDNQDKQKALVRTLTCGAELEFLMPNHEESETIYAPLITKLALAIKFGTSSQPVAAVCHHQDFEMSCLVCVSISREDMLDQETAIFRRPSSRDGQAWGRNFPAKHSFYVVKAEDKHQAELRRGPERAIELATPVFRKRDVDEGLLSLDKVFRAFAKMSIEELNYDASCGLHIHTGLLKGVFAVDAKRLITLILMLESVFLRDIIPRHRQYSPFGAGLIGSSGFGLGDHGSHKDEDPAEMAAHLPWGNAEPPMRAWNNRSPRLWRDALRRIWNSPSLVDLAQGVCRYDRYNGWKPLSFVIRLRDGQGRPLPDDQGSLRSASGSRSGGQDDFPRSTFEFRYPTMTFEVEFIQFWLEICNKLTEIASLPTDEYKGWIKRLDDALDAVDGRVLHERAQELGFPKPEVRAILTELKLPHIVESWARVISENPSKRMGPQ
ncbi:hypothetical protein GQ602_000474 [Ophiocordyceps camponoti-floridani]|uniref:Amidoligase enzyme n=1 Tax=Ophiocordyceps camponoti-floridani TaxID=2030778 RepID=A0A8H4QC71_9HYPO|nr:hypothetical protein GQ602_000474 [Ophiocordyceps camponoti-floridani]